MGETKWTSARYRELIDQSLLRAGKPVNSMAETGEALRGIVEAFGYLLEILVEKQDRIETLESEVWSLMNPGKEKNLYSSVNDDG